MEAVRRSKAKRIRNLVSGSWTESKNVNAPAVGDMVVPMMEEISGGQSTAESCLYFFPQMLVPFVWKKEQWEWNKNPNCRSLK